MKNNGAIILVLLSIGLFYTFVNPQYKEVKGLQTVAGNYRDVLRNASEIVDLRDQLLVTYESFPTQELDRINKLLPDNTDTVRLAFDLDGMAARYGVSIKDIQAIVGAEDRNNTIILPEHSGTYEKATVSFTFVSTYANFIRLLTDLEKNLRIMDISSISFLATDTGLYEYKVSVETYWLK